MNTETQSATTPYFVPSPSLYPNVINWGLFLLALGFVLKLNAMGGVLPMLAGVILVLYGSLAWVGNVICENESGLYRKWEDRSFRVGMGYFIGAELVFFTAFILALMYLRVFAIPALGTMSDLWPGFAGTWPSSGPGGKPFTPINAWGAPAVNTLLLLLSAASIIWSRAGIAKSNRGQMGSGMLITLLLGITFLAAQFLEYGHASEAGITVANGAYGMLFYMLTGFHGLHLLVGLILLLAVLLRSFAGHFNSEHHFGIEAVAWYWNFVVVAPGLLVFIYFYWL